MSFGRILGRVQGSEKMPFLGQLHLAPEMYTSALQKHFVKNVRVASVVPLWTRCLTWATSPISPGEGFSPSRLYDFLPQAMEASNSPAHLPSQLTGSSEPINYPSYTCV